MYVIKKGEYFVAKSGACSYTRFVQQAKKFSTKEEAENERCPENEYVVNLMDVIA